MSQIINSRYFGYFDNVSDIPAHDPVDAPCLICFKPWTKQDVRTISLMVPGDNRSYFYRVHRSCHDELTEEEKVNYDSSLIDKIAN